MRLMPIRFPMREGFGPAAGQSPAGQAGGPALRGISSPEWRHTASTGTAMRRLKTPESLTTGLGSTPSGFSDHSPFRWEPEPVVVSFSSGLFETTTTVRAARSPSL